MRTGIHLPDRVISVPLWRKHQGRHAVSSFLLKRGLFLVALEFTGQLRWTFQFPPQVIYLR